MTSFGFTIPEGSPAQLDTAARSCMDHGLAVASQADAVVQGTRIALGGWHGEAEAAFAAYAGEATRVLHANADAFMRAAGALDRLAGDLERAQRITGQAASDCAVYQQQLATALNEAHDYNQAARDLSQQAALAPHPHAQAALNHQASLAADQAQAADGRANRARDQLELVQRQGSAADGAYQEEADQVRRQIGAAEAEIGTIPRPPGGASIPISITRGDINLAARMLRGAGNVANAARAATNPLDLRRLAGGRLTPAAAAAFLRSLSMAEGDAAKPQLGSLIDAAGGFVNRSTFGVLGFGNPNTARYRGGEVAAMIPIDPAAWGADGERLAAGLAEDGGKDLATVGIPAEANKTLGEIDVTGAPPMGYRGGGTFANDGRGGGSVLPTTDAIGNPITYKEYDIYPYQQGVNRGAERIVVGSNNSAYYTPDHYRTFIPIR